MKLRYYIDPVTGRPHIHRHDVSETEIEAVLAVAEERREEPMSEEKRFPPGWDAKRLQRVIEHYEQQTDEQAAAEDGAAFEMPTHTAMGVPVELVPVVRELIAKHRSA